MKQNYQQMKVNLKYFFRSGILVMISTTQRVVIFIMQALRCFMLTSIDCVSFVQLTLITFGGDDDDDDDNDDNGDDD